MRIRLLCVGGVRGPLASAVETYENRIRRYWRFEVTEVAGGAGRRRKPREEEVREAEAQRLLAAWPKAGAQVVALTRVGQAVGPTALADWLADWGLRSVPEVAFVVGGAFGLGQEVLRQATRSLSLSTMTLPHEIARLVLAEQLYRAGTILRNEPYHKGP